MTSYQLIASIRDVEGQFLAARASVAWVSANPDVLEQAGIPISELQRARDRLEAVYTIAMFSVFEEGLGTYLVEKKRRAPKTAESRIDKVASLRRIEGQLVSELHDVRRARNVLVHSPSAAPPVSLGQARSSICKFSSWL